MAPPLKTEKRFRPENGTEKLFGGEQTEFGLFNNLILPAAFRKACLDQPTSAPLFQSSLYTDTELTYDLYDKRGIFYKLRQRMEKRRFISGDMAVYT